MVALIIDPDYEVMLIQQRQETGADRWDEVWEGVYVMSPGPNEEHQDFVAELVFILKTVVPRKIGRVYPGINVSDRFDWTKNYRGPDVAVYYSGNPAENHDTFILGGPDLAIEIVSPYDRTREKLDFYAKVNTRELLIIDRDPWKLELYRLTDGKLTLVADVKPDDSAFQTTSIPLSWQLLSGKDRPQIKINSPTGQEWMI
jgi:Uma2 family endonuclease